MARVLAVVPDLLFGSRLLESLRAAGHEVDLVARPDPNADADVVIADLTADPSDRIDLVRIGRPAKARVLAFYSHVETEVRAAAEEAGFELVVPRSRIARDAGALVDQVLSAPGA